REIDVSSDTTDLLTRLEKSDNLYQQIALLAALSKLLGVDSRISYQGQQHTIKALIEEVYLQAGRLRLWSVLRHASGLLGKVDGDLGLAVSALLVAQKFIQVGRAYSDDSLISKTLQDDELLAKISQFCREDVRDQVLTQEVLLCLGMLVKARPKLFSELLTVRVSYLIILLTSQISREHHKTPDEAYEHIMNLAPSDIQDQIEAVLEEYQNLTDLPMKLEELHAECHSGKLDWDQDLGLEELSEPTEGWYVWRQHQGVIDRRPAGFIPQVWSIFKHTTGLVIGNKMDKRNRVASDMVLSDMTQGEAAFALLIEQMLNNIQAPEYRQLTVETLSALGRFFEQNPSLQVDEALTIDVTIGHAVHLAYGELHPEHIANYSEFKGQAWDSFYNRSPMETTFFIVSALRKLLTVRPVKEMEVEMDNVAS
uniref:glycoside hydrolase family 15 protein n=1 Tax=Paraglaciecola polaris TaxID=222814 RepID=UPI0030ED9D21